MKAGLWKYVLTSESKGGTNFPSLSSSRQSVQKPHRHHIPAPRLITCCSAFKLQRIKAKIAKFVSALLCDSIRHDSGTQAEVTGLDATEEKGSN